MSELPKGVQSTEIPIQVAQENSPITQNKTENGTGPISLGDEIKEEKTDAAHITIPDDVNSLPGGEQFENHAEAGLPAFQSPSQVINMNQSMSSTVPTPSATNLETTNAEGSEEPERKRMKLERDQLVQNDSDEKEAKDPGVKDEVNQVISQSISQPQLSMSSISPIQRELESDLEKNQEKYSNGVDTSIHDVLPEPFQSTTTLESNLPQINDSADDLQKLETGNQPIDAPHPSNLNSSLVSRSSIPLNSTTLPISDAPGAASVLPIINNNSNLINSSAIATNSQKSVLNIPVYSRSPSSPRKRLVLLYDKPRYYHMIMQLSELRSNPHEIVTIVELFEIDKLVSSTQKYDYLNICIEYNDEFENNLKRYIEFIEKNHTIFQTDFDEISYHIHFAPEKKWKSDYTESEKYQYHQFINILDKYVCDKIVHCSIINKYDMDTVYITERNELTKLGQEIQQDIEKWKNLRILDYGESSIRFLPGVKFPDTLETLNIGGGYALETLTGFKMPNKLRTLLASQGAIQSIDTISFSLSLERLELADNKIYFLNQVEFPHTLLHLDLSQNRIESLRGVNFPRQLVSLNLGFNPIESIKGVKFPDNLKYLDISNIPNESMTGVKFPDLLIVLNLQASMTNTRGLKLPPTLNKVILCDNGVNSINPLKLPNSIEVLYLNNNNIKTLNKVQFPSSLKELYLGDNLITTLKNVQFPPTLEVLDIEMDPDYDEHEKHITTLKDVYFPPNLKVLKLGYHSIKSIESFEFPFSLVTLSLAYNELKTVRNVRLGNNLKTLDLSGNPELTNIDQLIIPESVSELRIPPELIPFLPSYIIERANKKQLILKKSQKGPIYNSHNDEFYRG
ncbi:L domain-like protein [Suhomyces tanzawaensis NRRL Y-17324]|uniref:L domain-like protein n=1 Tax=Suhomyces tanzawaensis NRRL Y-17324 TaxID=984487 RepID=A0A1E4SD86_9ASCO|nr:L domain-like protein [Suhomyces tanzawaensis NRRL Y-17324]ODV77481.1 L domain-like protein [Suhomyces tanzawaensis NRRL Y-17324]